MSEKILFDLQKEIDNYERIIKAFESLKKEAEEDNMTLEDYMIAKKWLFKLMLRNFAH